MEIILQSLVLCQPYELMFMSCVMFYEHEEFESKDGILKGCDLIKLLSMLSCDTQVWSHVLVMLD